MNKQEARCDNLIEETAVALKEDVVASMLVAVQKDNLGLSVNLALKRSRNNYCSGMSFSVSILMGKFSLGVRCGTCS